MGLKATANFEELLREYAPHKLIEDRQKKTNYFWNKLTKDKSWKDGVSYQIPWELSEASSFEIGGLIESAKITDAKYKKGTISQHALLTGAMKYHSRDLKRYGDMKQSFLKLLPKKAQKFSDRMKYLTNIMLLDKGSIAKGINDAVNALATGVIKVTKPQRFMLNERIVLVTSGAAADKEVYVKQINIANRTITVADSAGVVIDLTTVSEVFDPSIDTVTIKIVGYDRDEFFSFTDHLLPASLGGSDSLNGIVTKTDAPIFQPQVIDGAAWTSVNILDKLYDTYFEIAELGKVDGQEMLCGYNLFKAASRKSEASKRYTSTKESGIGFKTIVIDGPEGEMRLTTFEEMPDDKLYILDWASFVFAGDEFFKPMKDMNGNSFYTERVAGTGNGGDGYVCIQDIALSGQMLCIKGSGNGVVHSIPTL